MNNKTDLLFSEDSRRDIIEKMHRNSDGSGYYKGDGYKIIQYSDGCMKYSDNEGNRGKIYSDGSGYFKGSDGSRCRRAPSGEIYNYESRKEYFNLNEDIETNIGIGIAGIVAGMLGGLFVAGYSMYKNEESEKNNKSNDNINKMIAITIIGILAIALAIFIIIMNLKGIPKKGEVKLNMNAKDCIGVKYEEVEKSFKDNGFGNVKVEEKNDSIRGWYSKNNETVRVTIDGSENFKKGDIVSKEAEVIIYYHTNKY